jgi:hypothetical protein
MLLARVKVTRMRLIHTSVATVAVLAVSGTAFAAGTEDELTRTMGGTSRVVAGGKLEMVVRRASDTARNWNVVIRYETDVRSKTVIGFTVHPCKSITCKDFSSSNSRLSRAGHWRMKFNGRVPVKTRDDGTACLYVQLRDRGPTGKPKGQIIHRGKRKGLTYCGDIHQP